MGRKRYGKPRRFKPVSYTHLDVYKRQEETYGMDLEEDLDEIEK